MASEVVGLTIKCLQKFTFNHEEHMEMALNLDMGAEFGNNKVHANIETSGVMSV